jgi:hypothetical protein
MKMRKLFALAAVAVVVAFQARAELLTFDEDYFGTVVSPDDPLTSYTMVNGVTLTFQNLTYWWPENSGPFADDGIAYGSSGQAVITFSQPVYVPSIWVGSSVDGSFADDSITGSLSGGQQFTLASPVTTTGGGSWQEVTAGAGIPIDRLELGGDFLEGWIGQMEVNPVPEPSTVALALIGAIALLLRRRK